MATEQIFQLEKQLNQSVIGQEDLVRKMIITLLANGHLLLEGLPGLAKTRAINALAKNLELSLNRIQFTPDLLPSDITGTEVYQPEAEQKFSFERGPIFANLVLADEINRAPAKVQSALLEAMEERQVTVSGTTHPMEELFFVLATQNPIEQEGTYPLPEAQMDRFFMKVLIHYPSKESEKSILELVKGERRSDYKSKAQKLDPSCIGEARAEVENITCSEGMIQYIVDIVDATRFPDKYDEKLKAWIEVGSSPRGTIALELAARCSAWMEKRDYVSADDIRAVVKDVLRHRLLLTYEANAGGITPDHVIDHLISVVALSA
ncbi:MAG: AAA family ATPase [Schleiferiaceae bacterium]